MRGIPGQIIAAMPVDVVAVLMIVISIGFVAQPALDAHAFGLGVVASGIEQLVGLEIAVQGAQHRRRRIGALSAHRR